MPYFNLTHLWKSKKLWENSIDPDFQRQLNYAALIQMYNRKEQTYFRILSARLMDFTPFSFALFFIYIE